jgi:hypothetical protein
MQTCISLFNSDKQKAQACVEVLKAGSNPEAAFALAVRMAHSFGLPLSPIYVEVAGFLTKSQQVG